MSQNTSQSRLKGSLLTEVVENAGRPERTRTVDLYRVNLTRFDFTTTYKTAGTAKVRGSHTRHQVVWVGLWVGNVGRISREAALSEVSHSFARDLDDSGQAPAAHLA